jgi:lipid kinase YegS
MTLRILLNGKKASLEPVREAIYVAREHFPVEVRVTWEGGDIERLVREASAEGCHRILVAGGDGTANEAVNGLMGLPKDQRPELALMPLGTANDFATACEIPLEPIAAIKLAKDGKAIPVDCIKANERYFINVASGGFGAQITSTTPVALKNFLGGGAYTLTGIIRALNFVPYTNTFRLPDIEIDKDTIVGAVCNGRMAGGGQKLAPHAFINDGFLEAVAIHHFPIEALSQVVKEIQDPSIPGTYVSRYTAPWAELESEAEIPMNLDGEPFSSKKIRFEVIPESIKLVLSENSPVIL